MFLRFEDFKNVIQNILWASYQNIYKNKQDNQDKKASLAQISPDSQSRGREIEPRLRHTHISHVVFICNT